MSQTPAQEFFRKGIAAAQAGDLASAETLLRQCVTLDPKNATAMLNLGIVLVNRGNTAAAEQMLFQSVNTQASIENISTLANVLEINGKPAEAENCYNVILNASPNHPPTLAKLAALAEEQGDRKKAREWYKKLWEAEPSNIAAGIAYAIQSFTDDPSETTRTFEKLMDQAGNDEAAQSKILMSLLPYREFHERMKRGAPAHHATNLNELFFTHAASEFQLFQRLVVKNEKADSATAIKRFIAAFCSRDYPQAQKLLQEIQASSKDGAWVNVTFDSAFYAKLDSATDDPLFAQLPAVSDVLVQEFSARPIIFLACNSGYFSRFGMPLLRSLAENGATSQVHLHLMDASDDQLREAVAFCKAINLNIAVSAENSGIEEKQKTDARSYYHAIRFVRFYQFLRKYKNTLWMMDVDALFNRNPKEMFSLIGKHDVAVRIRAGRIEPWNQFSACIVGAALHDASLNYFRLVSAYILEFYERKSLRWGIDQLALFSVFEYLREQKREPSLAFVDAKIADLDYSEDGVVWLTAGAVKFQSADTVKGSELTAEDLRQGRYRELLKKFS